MASISSGLRPAEMLVGQKLTDGWEVVEVARRSSSSTGGKFSVGYKVENEDGRKAYLKALDLSEILQAEDAMEELEAISHAFNFEVKICNACKDLENVVSIMGHGKVDLGEMVPGMSQVFYLLFEEADDDIRAIQDHSDVDNDLLWKLRVLKNVAQGLSQLHEQGITHQDLKPSNVLGFPDGVFKIADLGCCSVLGMDAPRDGCQIPGDRGYAPLELQYGLISNPSFTDKCSSDLYLLGSLFYYHFAGTSALSAIYVEQMTHRHPMTKDFRLDLPFWRQNFALSLDSLSSSMEKSGYCKGIIEGVISIVSELCEPDPSVRGSRKRRLANPKQRLSLQRQVSRIIHLERLAWVAGL